MIFGSSRDHRDRRTIAEYEKKPKRLVAESMFKKTENICRGRTKVLAEYEKGR